LEALKTASEGDFQQAIMDLGLGASGSILGDVIGDMYPLVKHAMFITDTDDTTYGEVLLNDVARVARNVSTLNNFGSLATALNTGLYITKNDTVMGPLDTVDAFLKAVTGLTPNHIQDIHLKRQSVVNRQDKINSLYSAMLPDYKAYQRALREGDEEARNRALVALKSWFAVTGLRADEERSIISRLRKNSSDVQGQTSLNFLKKGDIPEDKQQQVRENEKDMLRKIQEDN
jgi:hypothetical protein